MKDTRFKIKFLLILVLSLSFICTVNGQDDKESSTASSKTSQQVTTTAAATDDPILSLSFSELFLSNWQIPVSMITAFILAYSVGANDVANPFGTAVGSGALTVKQVYVMATIFETLGAAMLGLLVAETIRSKLIFVEHFTIELFVLGEICAMFGAAAWQIIATIFGLPVSGTHSIVGATCGFALVEGGTSAVRWGKIIKIVISWVASPAMAGGLAVALYIFIIKNKILNTDNTSNDNDEESKSSSETQNIDNKDIPMSDLSDTHKITKPSVIQTLFYLPFFYALTVAFNIWAIGTKGLEMFLPNFYETSDPKTRNIVIVGSALTLAAATFGLVKYVKLDGWRKSAQHYNSIIGCIKDDEEAVQLTSGLEASDKQVQKAKKKRLQSMSLDHTDGSEDPVLHYLFSKLQSFAACFDAFAHGANDVGNSIGPVIACYAVLSTNDIKGEPKNFGTTKLLIVLYAAFAMCIGLLTLGRRVIKTVGSEITQLTPARGFSIDIMSGVTVVVGSLLGIPLSTTHCKVGAVAAVGYTYDKDALKWETFKNILYAWIITVPASGGISAILYLILKYFLNYQSLEMQ